MNINSPYTVEFNNSISKCTGTINLHTKVYLEMSKIFLKMTVMSFIAVISVTIYHQRLSLTTTKTAAKTAPT